MLDVQRQRYSTTREDTALLRFLLIAHLVIGPVVVLLLVMHELVPCAVAVLLWFVTSVGAVLGLMNGHAWCRAGLAALFLLLAIGGGIFVNGVVPNLKPERPPVLPYKVLPLWAVGAVIFYAASAVVIMMSERIKKVSFKGFSFFQS